MQSALQQVAAIREQFPHNAQAGLLAGIVYRRQGQPDAAQQELQPLAEQFPDVAQIQFEYGLTLRAGGDLVGAITALRRTVSLDGQQPRAWQVLGEVLSDRGETEAAEAAFHQQMAVSARHPGLVKAVEYAADGKLGMAEGICRDYLYRYPTDVDAIRLLADIGLQLGIVDDAEKLLHRCLELAPDYHLARNNYANALGKANRLEEALSQIVHLERVDPGNLAHPVLGASVMVNAGDYDGAIERYQRVLQKVPDHSRIRMSLGHALKTVGKQEASIMAYRHAIQAEPTLGEAYWSLANLKTFRFRETEIDAMRQLVDTPGLDTRDEFHVCFSLGKALEDGGSFDESFDYYAKGNAIKHQQSNYRADDTTELVNRFLATCDADLFNRHEKTGHPAADPIFIVGLPRSGSTLLEQILASHSQVDGTMELPNVLQYVRRLSDKKNRTDPSRYPEILTELSADQLNALGEEYLTSTRVHREGAAFFIDKMPNNYLHVGLIKLMLPNAKVIDARRHPMATCFSCYKQLFAAGQEFTYSLSDIATYYNDYSRVMAHWDQVIPDYVLRMEYEKVVDDFENQVRRLLEFCGLPFEDACLSFFENKRAVRTASSEQVRQPIYTSGLEQWRHYETHLKQLREVLTV